MAQHPNSLANLIPGGKKGAKHAVSASLHKIAKENIGNNQKVYDRIMSMVNSENDDVAFKGLTLYVKTFIITAEKTIETDVEDTVIKSADEQKQVLLKLAELLNKKMGSEVAS